MEFGPIPAARFEEVLEHLRYNFPDEPLNQAVGLCQTGKAHAKLEHHDLMTLKDGLSVMAVDPATGEIAGVALNGISRRGDVEEFLKELEIGNDIKFKRIMGLLFTANHQIDLFSKYNVDKIFELRILSVDARYRGRGLARELFLRSELIAEEYGFKIFKVDATSYFTQKVAENLGLVTVKEVVYGDFQDENGKKIYCLDPPHYSYKIMLKYFDESSSTSKA